MMDAGEVVAHNLKINAMIEAVKVRVVGMQAANAQHPDDQPHSERDFFDMADEIERLSGSFASI